MRLSHGEIESYTARNRPCCVPQAEKLEAEALAQEVQPDATADGPLPLVAQHTIIIIA